jgi:hypothetical protein
MVNKPKKINKENTKLGNWILYVVVAALVPIFMRAFLSFRDPVHVPYFFMNAIDLFWFCITLVILLYSELKQIDRFPFDIERETFSGFLMLYFGFLCIGMGYSMLHEHDLIGCTNKLITLLKSQAGSTTSTINTEDIENIEIGKKVCFIASLFCAIFTLRLYYVVKFPKKRIV